MGRRGRPSDGHVPHVDRYLIEGEHTEIAVRLHWVILVKPVGVAVLAAVALLALALWANPRGSALTDVLVIVVIALVVRAGLKVDWWRRQWLVATNRRIMLVSSFIGHTVSSVNTSRVTHLSYDRTVLGGLLGYAHFVFQSAGRDQPLYTVKFVPGDLSVYRAMVSVILTGTAGIPGGAEEATGARPVDEDPTRLSARTAALAQRVRRVLPRDSPDRRAPTMHTGEQIGAWHEPLDDE